MKKTTPVRGALLLYQPRKRISGDMSGRRFDDVFGSRMWKGRPSAVYHFTPTRLTVWKQRGGYLARRWGRLSDSHYPWGLVERVGATSEDGPPTRVGPPIDDEQAKARRERDEAILKALLDLVRPHPSWFSRDTLMHPLGPIELANRGRAIEVGSGQAT